MIFLFRNHQREADNIYACMHNLIPMLKDIGATGIIANPGKDMTTIKYGFGNYITIVASSPCNVLITLKDVFGIQKKITCKPNATSEIFMYFFGQYELQYKKGLEVRKQIARRFPLWKVCGPDYGLNLYNKKFYVCVHENGTIQILDEMSNNFFTNFKMAHKFLKTL